MVIIQVHNSECKVLNSGKKLDKAFKDALTYKDKSIEFSWAQNLRKIEKLKAFLENDNFSFSAESSKELKRAQHIQRGLEKKLFVSLYRDSSFPTGLLPRAREILNSGNYDHEIHDLRVKPKTNQVKYILKENLPPLRYYQKDAAKALEEAGRGIVVMPTGTGKTVTISRMIWDLEVKTLVITPGKSITSMMMDTLVKHFGKGKVEKLNTKTKVIKKPIAVCNIQALVKMDPKVLSEIDAVFIDEFHHSASETYLEVNLKHLKNVYYRIGVTATNFRNDGADLALESVLSNVLYEYDIKTAIAEGYLIRPEFHLIDNKNKAENTWHETYKSCIVENDARNEEIAEIANYHSKDQVLVLVQRIEHGETLKDLIPGSEFIHGQEKDVIRERLLADFRKGKLKCLVGSTVIGEGVDLPCCNVLVMAGGGKSKIQVMQNIGRALRIAPEKDSALIYDFEDNGGNWLEAHSGIRREIYQQYL